MLTRRALLAGGALSGAAGGAAGAGNNDAVQSSRGGSNDEQAAKALEEIRDIMRLSSGINAPELSVIRSLQREYLKGHGKFPDFIEIGLDVWEGVMNWYVRTRQQPQVTRTVEGRYSVPLFQTNLILRHDVSNNYIGPAYDSK